LCNEGDLSIYACPSGKKYTGGKILVARCGEGYRANNIRP